MQLEPMERLNMGISAGAIAASLVVATPHFAGSLAVGAALEAMNFRFLHRCSQAFFDGIVVGERPWLALFGLRFLLLAAGIVGSIWAGANPAGLVLGLSLVMPAVVIYAIRNRPPVVESPGEPPMAPDDERWDHYSIWRASEIAPDPEDER